MNFAVVLSIWFIGINAFAQEVSEPDVTTQNKDCDCSTEVNIKVSDQYATLEQRPIGSPILDENGERMIWPRF